MILSHPVSAGSPYAITVGEGGIGGKGMRYSTQNPGIGGPGGSSTAFGATGNGGGGGGCSAPSNPADYDRGLPGGNGGGSGGSAASNSPGSGEGNVAGPGTSLSYAGGPKGSSGNPGYYGGGGGGAGGSGGTGGIVPAAKVVVLMDMSPLPHFMLVMVEVAVLDAGWNHTSNKLATEDSLVVVVLVHTTYQDQDQLARWSRRRWCWSNRWSHHQPTRHTNGRNWQPW